MNELVRYDNSMNQLTFTGFTPREKDLFFSICSKVKDKGINEVTISFDDLRRMSSYTSRNNNTLMKDLKSAYEKLIKMNISFEDENRFVGFTLFHRYELNKRKKELTVEVSEGFKYMLNEWEFGNFTTFELKEFVNLKSNYSRDLYRLLKQYKTTGWYQVRIEDFRRILDVPKSYKMSKIDYHVLNPSIEELSEYFEGLKVEKVRAKKGNRIEGLRFTFKKQVDKNVIDVEQKKLEELEQYVEENTAKGLNE